MKKIWIIPFVVAALLMGMIFGIASYIQKGGIDRFGKEQGLILIEKEHMYANTGPYWGGRGIQVYRAVFKDKNEKNRIFWFRYGAGWSFDADIQEEVAPKRYVFIQ